jgi:hypothetical protein
VTLFDAFANRRLEAGERLRHDAFVDEITKRWTPTSARDRLLHRRAQLVHSSMRLFGGGPTLLQVSVGAAFVALSPAIRMFAPTPNTVSYSVPVPNWARILVMFGLFVLAAESFLSPRHLRTRRAVAWAIAPIPVVELWLLVSYPFPPWPHWPPRLAGAVIGMAIALLIAAGRRRHEATLRVAFVLAVAGTGALAIAEALRAVVFFADGDLLLSAASALTVIGATLIAVSLLRAHVEFAPDRAAPTRRPDPYRALQPVEADSSVPLREP